MEKKSRLSLWRKDIEWSRTSTTQATVKEGAGCSHSHPSGSSFILLPSGLPIRNSPTLADTLN